VYRTRGGASVATEAPPQEIVFYLYILYNTKVLLFINPSIIKMKKTFSLIVSFLLLASAVPAYAATATLGSTPATTTAVAVSTGPVFTRNLGTGATGQDVLALKKILSLELGTTDLSGAYNSTTATNVTAFQNKYAVEILIPLGLSVGTGYVGPSTIAELNILATKYNVKLSDFTIAVAPAPQAFDQNLSLGSTGPEVTLLKSVLSSNLGITLSATDVFDTATQVAVIQFQEKYMADILTPVGLTKGTGFVGASTRKKLNALLQGTLATVTTATTATSTQVATNSGATYGTNSSSNGTINNLGTYAATGTCPMYNPFPTYGTWGSCQASSTSITGYAQTRTASTTITGNASCDPNNLFEKLPILATTQSCTPPPLPDCPEKDTIFFEGSIDQMGTCLGSESLVSVITLKGGAQFEDKYGNSCKWSGSDDYRLIYPGPLPFDWLTAVGELNSALTMGVFNTDGVLESAPGGTNGLGSVTAATAPCVLYSDEFSGRVIDPSATQFKPKS